MDDETRAYLEGLRQGQAQQEQRLAQLEARFEARMTAEGERTRRHVGVLVEDLRHRLETVGEGVVASHEALDRLRHDVDERFAGVHVLMQAGFASLRRDIEELRARR